MDIVFILTLGLLIGSFLNVCIYRIPREESIAFPPSHCTSCGYNLKWYDLFPVLSWAFLGGKCRKCGERISLRYPLIELVTGILFVLTYMQNGMTLGALKFIILICFLIVIGMIDLDTQDVYLKTTLPAIIIGIIFLFFGNYLGGSRLDYIYGGLLGGGLIALIILITHGMGWGDAEICFMCGLFLGFKPTILMLFLSFIIGGIAGVSLILLKIKGRRDYMPFGPYISLAAIITILYGGEILNWYFSLL